MDALRRGAAAMAALLLLLAAPAAAHEFWMLPHQFSLARPQAVALSLAVGQQFSGDAVPFSQPLVAAMRHYSAGQATDLVRSIPARGAATLVLPLATQGTHLLALDTNPSDIELPAEAFHAYLREEGLDFVIAAREAAGTAAAPGRERYRRNVKTLIQVGASGDATYAQRTGQRLEIVPLADPMQQRAGSELGFRVLFDGQPLPRALVKFMHKEGGQPVIVKATTDAHGQVSVVPPAAGVWMASVVHMVPAADTPRHDWDSYWGNLSFSIGAGARPA